MDPTSQTIQQQFQRYYLEPARRITGPQSMANREFGFLLFKEKFMVRHRSFRTNEQLLGAIRDLVPAHVYFSTARYKEPTATMEKKGWEGADLVFDIDADHLDTECKPTHDNWKCKGCGNVGRGSAPKICPSCKNDRFEEQTWLCEKCLRQAKEETEKLLDIVISDFGVDPSNLRIFFSGHRGYHVHVNSKDLSGLDEEERKEIVDYVLGLGLETKLQGLNQTSSGGITTVEGPLIGEPGWRGRIVTGIYDLLGEGVENLQLGAAHTQTFKEWDREALFTKPFWNSVRGAGLATWQALALKAVQKKSSRIDTVVTTDIHRLIRLPGTLNGHTGLLAIEVQSERLDDFDPFAESTAFTGSMKVHVKEAPSFRLGNQHLGPFQDESVTLPAAAAMLLLCKRRAEPVA